MTRVIRINYNMELGVEKKRTVPVVEVLPYADTFTMEGIVEHVRSMAKKAKFKIQGIEELVVPGVFEKRTPLQPVGAVAPVVATASS